jgi:hypothetical protein
MSSIAYTLLARCTDSLGDTSREVCAQLRPAQSIAHLPFWGSYDVQYFQTNP